MQQALGRLTILALCVLSIVGSGLYPQRQAADHATDLLESRMNQKSRKAAFFIPSKTAFKTTEQTSDIPSFDLFLYSDTPALYFYRNRHTRAVVIDFFISLVGSEDIAVPVMYYSDKYDISPLLTFSLMYVESRFLPDAVNSNVGSVDRGIFQLNNRSFPHLREEDFFNPDLNASYAIAYLQWCLSHSSSQEQAVAMYNAGYGNITRGYIPETTQNHVQKVYTYRENLSREFSQYLKAHFGDDVPKLASVTGELAVGVQ